MSSDILHHLPLRRWSLALLFGAFMLSGIWTSQQAHAQQGAIQLFSQTSTYQPGKAVTVYVYFFRVQAPFGFFSSLSRHIGSSNDMRLQKRKRIVGFREQLRDSMGFPRGELSHEIYRLRLLPKRTGGVLRYGPIQYRGLQSNTLSFQMAAASSAPQVQTKMVLNKTQLKEGEDLRATALIRCPTSLCDYQNVNTNSIIQYLRKKTQVSSSEGLWTSNRIVTPQISTSGQQVEIRFRYRFAPLKSGKLQTPAINVSLPVAEVIDQSAAQTQIRNWLINKHKFSSRKAARYINIRPARVALLSVRPFTIAPVQLNVKAAAGCRGKWKLVSEVITIDGKKPYWHVGLQGRGFILQADTFLRRTLRKAIKDANLTSKLKLAHTQWMMPDETISGRGAVHFYFTFKGGRTALPALKMAFVDDNNKSYTQTTKALAANVRMNPASTNFDYTIQARKLYLYHDQAPDKQNQRPVDVWTFRLSTGFPTYHVLSRRWEMKQGLTLRTEQKMKNIVERSRGQRFGGAFFSMSSRTLPIVVSTGETLAREKNDLLAQFPRVQWGGGWVVPYTETSKGLTIQASTNRKKYFSGESIEYTLLVRCPSSECRQKSPGFYKQLFQSNIKLPNFDKFNGMRLTKRFEREEKKNGWTHFVYQVRFKAPQSKQVELKSATLELPRQLLGRLNNKENICFFRSGRSGELLLSSIARDHYKVSSQEDCSIGTQSLRTAPLTIPIEPLPENAKDVKLIGTFSLKGSLQQLSYPNKRATTVDKPFYLVVDITGSGDLKTARELLKDQMADIARRLRKKSVTADTQESNDKDLEKQGIYRLQLQLIAEQEGDVAIPSLKLKHYHREEGLLTAQTLPLQVKIEPRTGPKAIVAARPVVPAAVDNTKRTLQQETDLRPIMILGTRTLDNDWFALKHWSNIILLLLSPVCFLLFLGWHSTDKQRQADPQKVQQQRALKQFKQTLSQSGKEGRWEQHTLLAIQQFLSERLRLNKKQLTTAEVQELLQRHLGDDLPEPALQVVKQMKSLESSLYGGMKIDDQATFTKTLESHVSKLHRLLPQQLSQ